MLQLRPGSGTLKRKNYLLEKVILTQKNKYRKGFFAQINREIREK